MFEGLTATIKVNSATRIPLWLPWATRECIIGGVMYWFCSFELFIEVEQLLSAICTLSVIDESQATGNQRLDPHTDIRPPTKILDPPHRHTHNPHTCSLVYSPKWASLKASIVTRSVGKVTMGTLLQACPTHACYLIVPQGRPCPFSSYY